MLTNQLFASERREKRIKCKLPVQIHLPQLDVLLLTYLTDISKNGAFVTANRLFPVDSTVICTLTHWNNSKRIPIEGRVVHVRLDEHQPGMGIQFDRGDSEVAYVLDRLMDRIDVPKRPQRRIKEIHRK